MRVQPHRTVHLSIKEKLMTQHGMRQSTEAGLRPIGDGRHERSSP